MTAFRDLRVGQHFRFTDDRTGKPYGPRLKKVSDGCHARALRNVTAKGRVRAMVEKTCKVGPTWEVVPTGRASPVRKRKGRGRMSSSVLSGYSKRRRWR